MSRSVHLLSLLALLAAGPGCVRASHPGAAGAAPTAEPFDEWLLARAAADPSLWERERFTEVTAPLRRRLAYDRKGRRLLLLARDLPEATVALYASAPGAAPRLDALVADSGGRPLEPLQIEPYLASGGSWPSLAPTLPGHYDVTWETLGEPDQPWSFAAAARRVIADAARHPDLFEWDLPEAHGQTANVPGDGALLHPEAAPRCFGRWVRRRLREAAAACEGGDLPIALYQLGRSLHAVQDLASHRGISNAEHAWLSGSGQDPDEDPASLRRAKVLTRRYLQAVAAPALAACYARLQAAGDVKPLGVQAPLVRLGFHLQLTVASYRAYKALAARYRPEHHVTWYEGDGWAGPMDALAAVALGAAEPAPGGCLADQP